MKNSESLFSMTRFLTLCRKELKEDGRKNLLRVLLIFATGTVVFLWFGYIYYGKDYPEGRVPYWAPYHADPVWQDELACAVIGLLLFGAVSASLMMEHMTAKTNRTATLMTPATSLEKYLVRWLIFVVGFAVIYLIAFHLADLIRYVVYHLARPEVKQIAPISLSRLVDSETYHRGLFDNMYELRLGIAFYAAFQSFFVLGSVVWPKNAVIKSAAALTLLVLVYVFVGWFTSESLLSPVLYESPDWLTEKLSVNIFTALLVVVALFNWTLAYFRFKESEIIERW